MNKAISILTFLPANIVAEAKNMLQQKYFLHFTFSYFIKELLVLSALGYFIHFREHEKKLQLLQVVQFETNLDNLKAQLQPHFSSIPSIIFMHWPLKNRMTPHPWWPNFLT
jgi:hypothetical protein